MCLIVSLVYLKVSFSIIFALTLGFWGRSLLTLESIIPKTNITSGTHVIDFKSNDLIAFQLLYLRVHKARNVNCYKKHNTI